MPIYEYECRSCQDRFESLIWPGKEQAAPKCPRCGGSHVKRVISRASVVRSSSQKKQDRMKALAKVDPQRPQEVARYFKDHGSRFGEADFRGKKAWRDAVDRVAEGGPTLEEK